MIEGGRRRHRRAKLVPQPDHSAQLELEIKQARGSERRSARIIRLHLAERPPHGRAADDDRT